MATAPSYIQQFASPFTLGPDGVPLTVEQDSPAEIGAAILNIMVCPQGAAFNNPSFGIPSPIFDLLDLDTAAIVAAVQKFEPRATTEVVQQAITEVTHPQQVLLNVNAEVSEGFTSSVNPPPMVSDASSSGTGPSGPPAPGGGGVPAPVTPPTIT